MRAQQPFGNKLAFTDKWQSVKENPWIKERRGLLLSLTEIEHLTGVEPVETGLRKDGYLVFRFHAT